MRLASLEQGKEARPGGIPMDRYPILMQLLTFGIAALTGPITASETLTPETAVSLALANHPALKVAESDVDAADADRRVARSGYLPRLDFSEDLARSTNPVFVFASKLGQENFGPQDFAIQSLNEPDPYTNAATRLVLRQNVWDGGRTILYRKAAELGLSAARDASARSGEEVAFGALKAFWDAALAEAMLNVTHSAEQAAQANLELSQRQMEAGMAVPSDQMAAEVRLSEVQALRIRSEQGVRVSRAAIRQALGLAEEVDFQLSVPEVVAAPLAENEESRVQAALSARPDLLSLEQRIRQAEIGEDLARSRYYPEVGVGAQVEWNAKNAFGDSGSNWTVGATLKIPIFDGLESAARMDRARAELQKLEAMRRGMEDGIRVQVISAYSDCVSALERLKVADSAIGQSEEALRIVRERYTEGMAMMVELLGSEAARTSAQGTRALAARDLALARAALDLASARSLAPGGTSTAPAH